MNWKKSIQFLVILVGVFLAVVLTPRVANSCGSYTRQLVKFIPENMVSIAFPSLSESWPRIEDGGSRCRSSCWNAEEPRFTALIPKGSGGKTIDSHPNLFVFIPETSAKNARIVILDENQENVVYETSFLIPSKGGIVRVSLPETVSLEVDKNYPWYFMVICNPDDDIQSNETLTAWIARVEPSEALKQRLAEAKDPLEQAKVYAKEGLWYDTLKLAVDLRNEHPREWRELLHSIELDEIAEKPVVDCCIVEN